MLNLADRTDPSWLDRVLPHLDEVLLDHAHCEKKAAGAAVKLMFAYPHHAFMQVPLSRLAREELQHFELVLRLLGRRGIGFGQSVRSPWISGLMGSIRQGAQVTVIDHLVCCALIEGRSC